MRRLFAYRASGAVVGVASALAMSLGVSAHDQVGNQPGSGFHTVLSSAMRYVMNYEQQFALLAVGRALRAGAAAPAESRRQLEPQ